MKVMPMRVTRSSDAEPFEPVGHVGVSPLRLQGGARTPTDRFTVVLSHFAPGAEAAPAVQGTETAYVVISGEFTFESDGRVAILGALDSVHFTAGTTRSVKNEGAQPATMLVVRPKG